MPKADFTVITIHTPLRGWRVFGCGGELVILARGNKNILQMCSFCLAALKRWPPPQPPPWQTFFFEKSKGLLLRFADDDDESAKPAKQTHPPVLRGCGERVDEMGGFRVETLSNALGFLF